MRITNIFRACVFAVAAAFLIFVQDHSLAIGVAVLQFVASALAFSSLLFLRITKNTDSNLKKLTPIAVSVVVAASTVMFGSDAGSAESRLAIFKLLLAIFVISLAVTELVHSRNAKDGDRQELRISAAIGILAGVTFYLAPLDSLNAVGFFSAYLAISAVQLAVWEASPKTRKQNSNA